MHRSRAGLTVVVVVALALIAPPAAEAKTKSVQLSCGTSPALLIDKPGTYKIRTAVDGCASAVLVRIDASDVTLDLGGRVLDGHGTICLEGIHVGPNRKRIAIRNGVVSDCDVGIRSESHGPSVTNVVSFENDLGMDVKVGRFRSNVVAHSAGTGMTDDSGGTYVNNTVVSSGSSGIESLGAKLIERNTVIDAGQRGIFGGTGGRMEGNRAYGNASGGIFLADGKIQGNTSIGNGSYGIESEGDPIISGNRATANDNTGVYGEGGGLAMTDNVSRANRGPGLRVPASARGTGNRAIGNLGAGMLAGAASEIKQNIASGNVGLGIDGEATTIGTGANKASRNNGLGVQCDPPGLCGPDNSLEVPETFYLSCGAPFDITQSGTYFLGASVLDCGGGNAININVSDVTLDLQGHRIDGTLAFAAGINVDDGLTNVVVRNGTVSDYLFGVLAGDTQATIERIVAIDNFAAGIAVGDGARAERNTIVRTSTSGAGIIMNPGATAVENKIVANEAEGIITDNGPVTIKDNYIAGNGDAGIAYEFNPTNGSTITGNKLIGNGWVSVRVGNNNTIRNNVIKGSIDYPIEGGTGNTIKRNTIVGNSGGIVVDGTNTVTENTVKGNDGDGIFVDAGSTVSRNRVIGNTGNGIRATGAVSIKDNDAIGNGQKGIDAPAATGSGNTAKQNGGTQCDPPTLC